MSIEILCFHKSGKKAAFQNEQEFKVGHKISANDDVFILIIVVSLLNDFTFLIQGFSQHLDETDPERIKQIIERAVEDAKWVVDKVKFASLIFLFQKYSILHL